MEILFVVLCCFWYHYILWIFQILVQGEIGVFFPLIVLRSLDSSDSPLSQKASVLRWLFFFLYGISAACIMHEQTQFGHWRHLVHLCLMLFDWFYNQDVGESLQRSPNACRCVCELWLWSWGTKSFWTHGNHIFFFKYPQSIASEFLLVFFFLWLVTHLIDNMSPARLVHSQE
jgi:hypothetical protein